MVEELEVISDPSQVVELPDALPKVPQMLNADSDDSYINTDDGSNDEAVAFKKLFEDKYGSDWSKIWDDNGIASALGKWFAESIQFNGRDVANDLKKQVANGTISPDEAVDKYFNFIVDFAKKNSLIDPTDTEILAKDISNKTAGIQSLGSYALSEKAWSDMEAGLDKKCQEYIKDNLDSIKKSVQSALSSTLNNLKGEKQVATDSEKIQTPIQEIADDESVLEIEISADSDGEGGEPEKVTVGDEAQVQAEPVEVADEEVLEEVIDEEFLTEEDIEREAVLNEINEIADSADRSLNVKIPFIDKRSTKSAVAGKFLSLNKHLLDKKYHSLIDSGIKLDSRLYDNMIGSVKQKAKILTKLKSSKSPAKSFGFVDSGKGYLTDKEF